MVDDSEALTRFERELRHAWGLQDRSIVSYLGELKMFQKWLATRGLTLLTVERDTFLDWREWISTRRKPCGIGVAATALRGFYTITTYCKFLPTNPFPETMRIKIKRQEPADVPTVHQFLQMREALERPIIDTRALATDVRKTLIETLAGSGLRIEALLTLRPRHLHLGVRPHILVEHRTMSCKGKIAGQVPISPYCAALLSAFLKEHPSDQEEPMFKVSDSVIRKILHQIQPEGLRMKPHSLRHFYCSMTYFKNFDGGKNDIVWVRDAAGHTNISTTNNYLNMAKRVCQDEMAWATWATGQVGNIAAV